MSFCTGAPSVPSALIGVSDVITVAASILPPSDSNTWASLSCPSAVGTMSKSSARLRMELTPSSAWISIGARYC